MDQTGNIVPDPAELKQAPVDTQSAENPTSPEAEGDGHEENSEPSKVTESTPSRDDGQLDREALAEKREEGKLQQVQKELDDYKQKVEESKTQFEIAKKESERLKYIEDKMSETPEKFEKALIDINGLDQQSAKAYVENMKSQGYWNNTQNVPPQGAPATGQQAPQTPQTSQTPVDPYVAARQVISEEQENERIRKQLFEKVPELDPVNVPPEKQATMGTFAKSIEYEARRRIQSDASLDVKNLSDVCYDVYKDFTGKTDEQMKSAREEGRMQGYLEANADKPGSQTTPKAYNKKETSFGLSADELQQATAEGLTAEDFAKLKNPLSEVE